MRGYEKGEEEMFGDNFRTSLPRPIGQYLVPVVAAVLALMMSGEISAQEPTVRLLMRSDYLSAELLKEFTKSTGLGIEIDIYDPSSSPDVLASLISGTSGYDVVVPPANILNRLIEENAVQRLDWTGLSQSYALSSQVQKFIIRYSKNKEKPLRLYGVPYLWGTTGIGYTIETFAARSEEDAPYSLKFIFDPEYVGRFADCGVGMADAPEEIIRSALRFLGEDPLTGDPEVIRRAQGILFAIRPHIAGFYGADLGERLASGQICLALGWSGDILKASLLAQETKGGTTIGYTIPEEGGPIWLDMLAIPANARNSEGAYALIAFMMKDETMAQVSRYALYPSTNVAGNAQNWDQGLFEDRRIFPKWEVIDTLFMAPPEDEITSLAIQEVWSAFRSGKE